MTFLRALISCYDQSSLRYRWVDHVIAWPEVCSGASRVVGFIGGTAVRGDADNPSEELRAFDVNERVIKPYRGKSVWQPKLLAKVAAMVALADLVNTHALLFRRLERNLLGLVDSRILKKVLAP